MTLSIINIDIKKFISYINYKKKWSINTNKYIITDINLNSRRCLGRIWDNINWDINKQ